MKALSKLLAALLLAAMLPLAADSLPVLSLSDALAAAERNNITLEQAKVSLAQVVRNQDNVMSTFMPSLSVSAGIGPSWTLPYSNNDFAYDGLDLSASASASFTFTGSMLRDSQSRKLQKEAASLSYLSSYESVTSAVTSAYWQIAVLQSTRDLAVISLEDAYNSYVSVLESYESGQTDELTLYQTELSWNQAEYTLKTAEDSLVSALQSFRNMTGLEGDFLLEELDDSFTLLLPTAEELYSEYAPGTLDIRSARNSLAQAGLALTTARLSAYVPTLTAGLSYSYGGGWDATSWAYGSSRHELSASLTVNVDVDALLPGSSSRASVNDAKDALTLASLSLQETEEDLLETIRSGVTTIEQAQDNRTITEKTLKNAKRSYELSEEAFEAGLLSADDLASARNTYLSAETSCLSLSATHLIACYDLAATLNTSFEELKTKYSTETL